MPAITVQARIGAALLGPHYLRLLLLDPWNESNEQLVRSFTSSLFMSFRGGELSKINFPFLRDLVSVQCSCRLRINAPRHDYFPGLSETKSPSILPFSASR